MKRAVVVVLAGAVAGAAGLIGSSPALAATHYMFCSGGGPAGVYYSAVYPVPETTKSADSQKAFTAFVAAKYGRAIVSECHRNGTQKDAEADKAMRQAPSPNLKVQWKLIETGWAGR